jgi:Kef-type K+ transport system membrane component KefB
MSFDNLVVVLAVAAAVPLLLAAMPKLPLPGPVLEIVAGVILGPAVLGWVHIDTSLRTVSTIGLAFLLFLAGLEIDIQHFRGARARQAGLGLLGTIVLAAVVGGALKAGGLVESPLLIGIILVATSLGLIIPILKDAGAIERPVGQLAVAGASLGEVSAVVLLSLFFSEKSSGIGVKLLLLGGLAVLVTLVVIVSMHAGHSMKLSSVINRLADTSAQIRVRLSMLLVVGLATVALHLGFEAILGAFIAGGVLRLIDPDAERTHPQFHIKLEGLGYGFLIPTFFVTSGLQFNLSALFASTGTVLRVPLFLAALLLVRGLPAFIYRRGGLTTREILAAGLLQAISLPFIVAATTIGLQLGAIRTANAAALVAAGLLSVIIYPVLALPLLRRKGNDLEAGIPQQKEYAVQL